MRETTSCFMSAPIDTQVRFTAADSYRDGHAKLAAIYSKAKAQQWNAERDIDWSHQLDPDNPLQMPEASIALAGSAEWRSMSHELRGQVRRHVQGWQISQILHGEQAGLMALTKLVSSHTDMGAKLCAAAQIIDEARHIEVYSRLLYEKITVAYPISRGIALLMGQALAETRHDFVSLGIQILIEGAALGFFKNIQAYTGDTFIRHLQALVLRDEARHFAVGRLCLAQEYSQLSAAELDRREEFVIECLELLRQHLHANDVWESLDLLSGRRCKQIASSAPITANLQRSLLRQLVPAICGIGLVGARMRAYLQSIDAADYAQYAEAMGNV